MFSLVLQCLRIMGKRKEKNGWYENVYAFVRLAEKTVAILFKICRKS